MKVITMVGTDSISISYPENPKEGTRVHLIFFSPNIKSEPVVMLGTWGFQLMLKRLSIYSYVRHEDFSQMMGPCSVIAEIA